MTYNLEQHQAWNFLKSHQLGTLATVNEDGTPEQAAVFFFINERFHCYFVTKSETRKYLNMLRSPRTSLLVYSEPELYSVELQGRLEAVTDSHVVTQTIANFQTLALTRKVHYWIPPISQLELGTYVVCRLATDKVIVSNYNKDLTNRNLPQQLSFSPQSSV